MHIFPRTELRHRFEFKILKRYINWLLLLKYLHRYRIGFGSWAALFVYLRPILKLLKGAPFLALYPFPRYETILNLLPELRFNPVPLLYCVTFCLWGALILHMTCTFDRLDGRYTICDSHGVPMLVDDVSTSLIDVKWPAKSALLIYPFYLNSNF